MRRNSALAVDTTTTTMSKNELAYELELSPRSSVFSEVKLESPVTPQAPTPTAPHLTPSIKLLFSQLPRRHLLLLLLPAVISSMIAGGIAPFMTFVVGEVFASFAAYPQTPNPPQAAKDELLHGVGMAAVQLIALAVGSLALSSVTSCLWIWTGERNVMALRKRVYEAVTEKDMVWFDTKMGAEENTAAAEDAGPLGAGGLMAKFTHETDDVRTATSLASGQLLQYLTTCITCLFLAFLRSWALTLVILSAVPLLIVIQALSQALAGPLLANERSATATAATLVDRALASIATVKAFNAQAHELGMVSTVVDTMKQAAGKLNVVWGVTSAMGQFVMMAMFVQGFWFGSKLVKEGKIDAGDVMSVFWACLIATSNLQMCIPQLITVAKGKYAVVALLTLVGDAESAPVVSDPMPVTPSTVTSFKRSHTLRKIRPATCAGELSFHNVSFTYPSRPSDEPTLQDVTLFLPAHETTFIVGTSGSGKSTIAALLLRMYAPNVGCGEVCLDERDVRYLDEAWIRSHVAGVGQGADVVFEGMTVRENILVGSDRVAVSDAEVEDACRMALLHEFVRELPDGYDTVLGQGGVSLSGGQRQRLAIARARLRDPTVLVLDEATSALDATSRLLVFAALREWRRNKTTIVITHDLSQIEADDFVYVMKSGHVVEQGYRQDLERCEGPSSSSSFMSSVESLHDSGRGEFRKMLDVQLGMGGYLPIKDIDTPVAAYDLDLPDSDASTDEEDVDKYHLAVKHQTLLRPLTLGNWMFDVVADLTSTNKRETRLLAPAPIVDVEAATRKRRPSSLHIDIPITPVKALGRDSKLNGRRMSLQFTPTSPVFSMSTSSQVPLVYPRSVAEDDEEFQGEKDAMTRSATLVHTRRSGRRNERTRWDVKAETQPQELKKRRWVSRKTLKSPLSVSVKAIPTEAEQQRFIQPSFWSTVRTTFPTIPHKPLLFIGLLTCLLSGAMTPLFSFLLSRLLFEVSTGAQNTSIINRYGGIVLAVAAVDGILIGLKYFLMETSGMVWITALRKRCFSLVLKQDKKWFDKSDNTPVHLVQVLVKDGDDARNLISVVAGQCVVVVSMLSVGLIWAMARGWQLTMVGLAIGPVFAGVMAVQTKLVAGCEVRNKRAREDVARGYYDAISNIRGIRAMSFETVFRKKFDKAADKALATGVRGAFVEGCTYGVASGLIYLAEALLFYVGAVLISKGTYTYLQMVEVLNLVVFTVTIGSQLMAFTQQIAKAIQATHDFNQLLKLADTTPSEAKGILRPEITGPITFSRIQFSYPERPDVPILKNISLSIAPGESVAIVGASGSGKSTIAALLQRLYEPDAGSITVGGAPLSDIDVHHLRHHISVVSQHPNLFDASIADNIRYGSDGALVTDTDVQRAAKEANVHEFIMGLPRGYDTHVGENAGLISGGQAQRLQIARALVRPARVLILDECTSALDAENQRAVLEAIGKVQQNGEGRTTVMVTHKLQVMQMCDRILVVADGEVKEQGTFDELVRRKGVFATLASGGEWVGE